MIAEDKGMSKSHICPPLFCFNLTIFEQLN